MAEVVVQVELLTLLEDVVCVPFLSHLGAKDGDEVAASCNLADRDDRTVTLVLTARARDLEHRVVWVTHSQRLEPLHICEWFRKFPIHSVEFRLVGVETNVLNCWFA